MNDSFDPGVDDAEDVLRAIKRRYESLIGSAPLGVARATLEGRLVTVNAHLRRLLRMAEADLVGEVLWDRLDHPDAHQIEDIRALRTGEADIYSGEHRYTLADGSGLQLGIAAAVVRSWKGVPESLVIVMDATGPPPAPDQGPPGPRDSGR